MACKFWAAYVERDPLILSEAIRHGQQVFGHDHLKPAQLEAVKAVIQGRDTFVNVPTGYGKSLVHQVLPFCASFILERLGKAGKTPPAVLVVSSEYLHLLQTTMVVMSHKSCSTRSLTTLPS